MNLQFYFFVLLFFSLNNIQIKCQNWMVKEKLDNIKEEIKSTEISLHYGIIQEESITLLNSKYISFDDGMLENDLLIHIFPINCKIKVNIENEGSILSKNKNLDEESYSFKILKNKLKNSEAKINLSLNQNSEDLNNRECPLVINSMFDEDHKLTVEEHNPTTFHFDENLQNINLEYSLEDFDDDSYVVFSFLFNEKASFQINIKEEIEYNQKRIISNSHNVFLTKKSFVNKKIKSLNINFKRIGGENKPVVLTFRVISNKYTPLILQKNHLNQGFITSNNDCSYYYMEVFQDEEGEIILHDKRQNGQLIGRICNKNTCPINDTNSFSENYKNLEYKDNFRKLKFNFEKTQECDRGCYLLISYYHDTFATINNTIIGFEFTLLTRIWDKNDWSKTNIVNIPNNEYIFGYFEKNIINHHYYSILIRNQTKLILEIKGKNYNFFYGEGKRKLNTYNILLDNTYELAIDNEMDMKNISYKINKSKYLSFAIRPKNFFDDIDSFYYFRIFQIENIDNLIMPFDSNIENNCKKINLSLNSLYCAYLLKNDYNEFYLNFSITHSSILQNKMNRYAIFQSKKAKLLDINEKILEDLFIFDNDDKFSIKPNIISNISNVNLNYILLIFKSPFQERESYLSFFNDTKNEIFPHIYSNQIYQINSGDSFVFSLFDYYYLYLNWINGRGEIQNFYPDNYIMDKNDRGKVHSALLSANKVNEISFGSTVEFFLNIRLKYYIETIGEIKQGEITSQTIQNTDFPIYFYSELIKSLNTNHDINIRIINNNNNINKYSIQGMFCEKEIIKKLEKGENIGFNVDLNALFDSSSNNGLIHIPFEKVKEKEEPYILIKIDEIDNSQLNSDIIIQIIALYKMFLYNQEIYDFIPINQFVTGLKNLEETNTTFYIMPESNTEDELVLEFSTNNSDIMLDIKGAEVLNEKENIDKKNGIEKYIINSSSITEATEFVIYNFNNNKYNNLLNGRYILRYYYLTTRFSTVNYEFNGKYNISRIETNTENITKITLVFDNLNIYNNTNNNYLKFSKYNDSEIKGEIEYIIYLNLFYKNSTKELLNSTAIISAKPIEQYIVISSNKKDKFKLDITVNKTNVTSYIFEMQIKFHLKHPSLNDEMVAYSVEMDLTEILKKKKKDDDDNSEKLINSCKN